jgi:hypothetical protein
MNRSPSIPFQNVKIHGYSVTPDHDERVERARKTNPNATWARGSINMPMFARMLAKTAHAMVVAEYGLHSFVPMLPDVILHAKEPAYLVGSATERTTPPVPMKNWVRIEIRNIRGVKNVAVFLRLFAYEGPPEKGTPTYAIIVGRFVPWWERLGRLLIGGD